MRQRKRAKHHRAQKQEKTRIVVFIGMPGAGKSKVGRRIAEQVGCMLIDIDARIEQDFDMRLCDIVASRSPEEFAEIERATALRVLKESVSTSQPTVIATGGSVVYYEDVMQAFSQHAHIIHLYASLEKIEQRINKKPDRGIVFAPGETIVELYARRMPLYERWADHSVCTEHDRHLVAQLLAVHLTGLGFFATSEQHIH